MSKLYLTKDQDKHMVEVGFSYTDEFGQKTNTTKTLSPVILDTVKYFELLVDEFKYFLLGCGFARELVDRIEIAD